ncbi:MAG TPA: TonB family protein [Bryobacteraceae bacterium]|nr:TonB family protein [Bryobacteraceae bacterium]
MSTHVDFLAEQESLRKPLLVSTAFHGCLIAALAIQGFAGSGVRELWGNPNSLGGGAVGITPVSQIPLPARGGPPNPLASDTESEVPEPPQAKRQARRAPEADPAAIAIKSRGAAAQPARRESVASRSKLPVSEAPNQLYSNTGRALSSPMVGQTGSGGVGIGPGGAFGNRFGAYRDLLEQMVARRWRTSDVDPRLQTAPPVIVTFVIRRDGSSADVRLEQSSGNKALDYSALRAVYEAGPFPPLPPTYERNDARIEFWFQLKR